VSGEDPERSSDKLFACITNRPSHFQQCSASLMLVHTFACQMNFPARHIGIIRAIWVMLSRRSSRQADRQNISAASMDVTPIALEVYGTCSQLPRESTLRPPSRRSMWSLRRPPQQHAVDRPEHAQLASNLCEKSAASALWNPSASTIEEAQNGLRVRPETSGGIAEFSEHEAD